MFQTLLGKVNRDIKFSITDMLLDKVCEMGDVENLIDVKNVFVSQYKNVTFPHQQKMWENIIIKIFNYFLDKICINQIIINQRC